MSRGSIWFLLIFTSGCIVLMIGLMGSISGDCPRPVFPFPMPQAHCNALTAIAGVGLALMLVGGFGTAATGIYGAIVQDRRIGRDA